jgi:hypothetical protein
MMSFKLLLICFVVWFSLFFMVGVFFPFSSMLAVLLLLYFHIWNIRNLCIYWAFSHFFAHCLKS